jgi:hypothetical protein
MWHNLRQLLQMARLDAKTGTWGGHWYELPKPI